MKRLAIAMATVALTGCGDGNPASKSDNPYERPNRAVKEVAAAEEAYAKRHKKYTARIADLMAEGANLAEWVTHSEVTLDVSEDGGFVIIRATNDGETFLSFRSLDGARGDLNDN